MTELFRPEGKTHVWECGRLVGSLPAPHVRSQEQREQLLDDITVQTWGMVIAHVPVSSITPDPGVRRSTSGQAIIA